MASQLGQGWLGAVPTTLCQPGGAFVGVRGDLALPTGSGGGREGVLTSDALCHDVGHLAAGREHAHAQLVHHQHLGTGEHPMSTL